jgi:hypothetical protein
MAYTTINKGSSYFNTVLYTGDGASPKSITGVGFKPDFVWSKSRSIVENHNLYDAVRGGTQGLRSNSDAAETSSNIYGYVSTFNSDGVTYISGGTNNDLNNGSGVTFVNWNWLGANTTASNTSGSITSTVSANTTAGFSVVTYTGTGSAATVGHGLGVAPSMIFLKVRSATDAWIVYSKSLGNTKIMVLNSSAAEQTRADWNNTSPTSSVFSIGTFSNENTNAATYVAYCFAEIKGYSKIGSFVGNGSTDGPFVYTGFKPAFVIQKKSTTGSANAHWRIIDSTRSTYNVAQDVLFPSLSNSETNTETDLDILSNGFKIRNSGIYLNESGITYIYMAFASNPFVTSTQIPTTAR